MHGQLSRKWWTGKWVLFMLLDYRDDLYSTLLANGLNKHCVGIGYFSKSISNML